LGRLDGASNGYDDVDVQPDELLRQARQSVAAVLGIASFDDEVLAFLVPELPKTRLHVRKDPRRVGRKRWRRGGEHSQAVDFRLPGLRSHHERRGEDAQRGDDERSPARLHKGKPDHLLHRGNNILSRPREDPAMIDLGGAFEAQAVRIGSAVHRMPRAEAGRLVARVVRDASCATVALATAVPDGPALATSLREAGCSVVAAETLSPTHRADAGISVARLGVAETGSVLLASSPDDRRVELCVDVHIVLLEAAALVATLDGALGALRELSARPPGYASLVSGPSRSADIERQL